jgi:hypothetical protein
VGCVIEASREAGTPGTPGIPGTLCPLGRISPKLGPSDPPHIGPIALGLWALYVGGQTFWQNRARLRVHDNEQRSINMLDANLTLR